jgi:hypothetical protein
MTLVQTLITAAVTFLVGYQGSITGTSRLRKDIRATQELLDALPADHPRRALLSDHLDELIVRLVRRQHRRFEPILPPPPASFTATHAIAALWLVGILAAASQVTVLSPYRYLVTLLTQSPGALASLTQQELWAGVTYSSIVLICSGGSLLIWRDKRIRRDPSYPALGAIRTETGSK